jgi:DNA-binding beta-propeller fold protein YncE
VCAKLAPDGTLTTIAGTGTSGYSGDGGPATAAMLSFPAGLALDARGNLYISDSYRIRKVGMNGVIATIAGTGSSGFSGDGGMALSATMNTSYGIAVDPYGNVLFCDSQNMRVRKILLTPPSVDDGGVVSAAQFAPGPVGIGGIISIFGRGFEDARKFVESSDSRTLKA